MVTQFDPSMPTAFGPAASPADNPAGMAMGDTAEAAIPTYADIVIADAPLLYWRLNETGGSFFSQVGDTATPSVAWRGASVFPAISGLGASGATPDGDCGVTLNQTEKEGIKTPFFTPAWGATDGFSVECWVRTTATSRQLLIGSYSGVTPALNLEFNRTPGQIRFYLAGGQEIEVPHVVHTGAWQHIVAVFNAGRMELFANGVSIGASVGNNISSMLSNATYPVWIGRDNRAADGSTVTLSGSIDEVAIYDKALTLAQIQAHYAAARSDDLLAEFAKYGFDPAAAESGYAVVLADLHALDYGRQLSYTAVDAGLMAALDKMTRKPERIILNGDLLGNYMSGRGFPASVGWGLSEAAAANRMLAQLAAHAPLSVVLGNHDTGWPEGDNETTSLGEFAASQIPLYDSSAAHYDIGGVRFVCLSSDGGAGFFDGQDTYLTTNKGTTQEVVVATHHPYESRVASWGGFLPVATILADRTSWFMAGHTHAFSEAKYATGSGSLVQWVMSTSSPYVPELNDGANPAMVALACRSGAVVGRWKIDSKKGYWEYVVPPVRTSGLAALPAVFDGIPDAKVAGAQWTVRDVTATAVPQYISCDSPISGIKPPMCGPMYAAVNALVMKFDRVAATKFYAVLGGAAIAAEFSHDGTTWIAADATSGPTSEGWKYTIPVTLPAGAFTFVRLSNATSFYISHFGFI